MVNVMNRPRLAGLVAVTFGVAASASSAASLDGKQPFICATLEIFSCDAGFDCEHQTAESIDAPQFLRFSLADKQIKGERPSGEAVNAAIELARQTEQRLYLQGVAAKVGWTVNISTVTGKMTLVATDDVSGYVAFGACTAR
jgi:hypothetical protein